MKKLFILMFLLITVFMSAESFIGEWNVVLYHIDKGELDGGIIKLGKENYCEIINSLSGKEEIREITYYSDGDFFFIGSSGYYFTWVDENHFELTPAFDTVYYRLVFRRQD